MAAAASASASRPTSANAGRVPIATAPVPMIGPNNVPNVAAPSTPPSVRDRRSAGVTLITQVRPPHQIRPQNMPWTARSRSSITMLEPKPNAITARANPNRPSAVVRRTPARVATQKPRNAPGIRPAGYAAASTPIAGFDTCSVWA